MRMHFAGWDSRQNHEPNRQNLKMAPFRTPLPSWLALSNKVLIPGDAAHSMVPYMSHGAVIAVKDGTALAKVLSLTPPPLKFPRR